MKNNMKVTLVIGIGVLTITIGLSLFIFFQEAFYGDQEKISTTTVALKREMEEKYGIVVTNSVGSYTRDIGYGATLTTEEGIEFDVWKTPYGSTDTYMEAVWRHKALDEWGYAENHIKNVEKVDVNVGYRSEEIKDIQKLPLPIEEVANSLWMSIYVDLKNPYKEGESSEVTKQILQYFQQLQKDQAHQVELIVRHQNDTGTYMILREEDGNTPTLSTAEDVSKTLFK